MHIEYWGHSHLPNLLLLHGFMGSSADFYPALPTLTQYFHCICVDLPGHGQTAITDHGFGAVADQILAIAPDQSYLCGYSLGGRMALYLAVYYPDRWLKVILESASCGLRSEFDRQNRQHQDSAIARKLRQPDLDFTTFIENWYQQPIFVGIDHHPNFLTMLERRHQNQPLLLAAALESLGVGRQPYLGDLVATNRIPLLLLAGASDPKFVGIGQEMFSSCTVAQLKVVPECSHNIHFQQLELWLKLVLEFLL